MVLLSFDTEEFDVPREHGVNYPLEEAMKVSVYGTNRILDCLKSRSVKATFFCTTNFAENAPDVIQRILREGHEVAAHGCDHWNPKPEDVAIAKSKLEAMIGMDIHGYRQPRMFPVSDEEIQKLGYQYNSSLNPAFIPGRYMHLTSPRTCFLKDGVLQIPASVTPLIRFPLFWLALHNLPASLYNRLAGYTCRHDGYFVTYFHPWEFYPLGEHPELKMPYIIRNHAGDGMYNRLGGLIDYFKARKEEFVTFHEFAETKIKNLQSGKV